VLNNPRIQKALERIRDKGLRSAGFLVSSIMKRRIKRSRKPSKPGQTPHTKRGQLRRAIRYGMAYDKMSVVIGPKYSMFGPAGGAHEYGGRYKGQIFPRRPFAGPALDLAMPFIGPQFKGTVY